MAAAALVRSNAVALVRPYSARWRSSRLLASPCETPMPRFERRRRSAATNAVRRAGIVFCAAGRISHSLQTRGYSPDLYRLRYTITIALTSVIGLRGTEFPCSCCVLRTFQRYCSRCSVANSNCVVIDDLASSRSPSVICP